jgi:predicted Zn-ribbon and HTH transcriptional regulator
VPRAQGHTDDVLAARAVNAQPWEPLPGMVKKRCSQCSYLFAVLAAEAEATSRCPDCAGFGSRPAPP